MMQHNATQDHIRSVSALRVLD